MYQDYSGGDHLNARQKAKKPYELFYNKAEEYHQSGEPWNVSIALAREFFGIPTVPEYTVERYRMFRTKGAGSDRR
jgi:hypothetical protein